MSRNVLNFQKKTEKPAEDRGPLISAEKAVLLFPEEGRPKPDYLRRRVSPRVKIGRLVLFYEQDLLDWIASHREKQAAS